MILKIIRKGKPNRQHKPLSVKCHACKEFDIFPPQAHLMQVFLL